MSKSLKKISLLFISLIFLFSASATFSQTLELTPEEKDILAELIGLENLDAILNPDSLKEDKKKKKIKTKKKAVQKKIAVKKTEAKRTPALTEPEVAKTLPGEQDPLEALLNFDVETIKKSFQEELFNENEKRAVASKPATSTKVEKTKSTSSQPANSASAVETLTPTDNETPKTETTDENFFNYAKKEYKNYEMPVSAPERQRRSALIQAPASPTFQSNNSRSSAPNEGNQNLEGIAPTALKIPSKKEKVESVVIVPPKLKIKLDNLSQTLTNEDSTEESTTEAIEEYQKLLELDQQKEKTPIAVQIQPERNEKEEQRKREREGFILNSLAKNMQKLQTKKPEVVHQKIIPTIIQPKITRDIASYSKRALQQTLKTLRNIDEPKSNSPLFQRFQRNQIQAQLTRNLSDDKTALLQNMLVESAPKAEDPQAAAEEAEISKAPIRFGLVPLYLGAVKQSEDLATTVNEEITDNLDEALASLVAGDSKQATALLKDVEDDLANKLLPLAEIKKLAYGELYARFKNEEHLSDFSRYMAARVIAQKLENGEIALSQVGSEHLKDMIAFIQDYKEKLGADEKLKDLTLEQSGCSDIETIKKDMARFENSLKNMQEVASQFKDQDDIESIEVFTFDDLDRNEERIEALLAEAKRQENIELIEVCGTLEKQCQAIRLVRKSKITDVADEISALKKKGKQPAATSTASE